MYYIYVYIKKSSVSSDVAVSIQICEELIAAVLRAYRKFRHVRVSLHPKLSPYFLLNQLLTDISGLFFVCKLLNIGISVI